MKVYDFDKTIYAGDSTIDFYLYCLKKHKKIILYLPVQIISFVKYKINMIDKLQFKESFFSFLKLINDIDSDVNDFWDNNQKKIYSWYISQQKNDDVIISASPEFLLIEIFRRLEIRHFICSKVNKTDGKFLSPNCYGEEKVKRFTEFYEIENMDEFYSDSKSDLPMATRAKIAFMVGSKGERTEWKA